MGEYGSSGSENGNGVGVVIPGDNVVYTVYSLVNITNLNTKIYETNERVVLFNSPSFHLNPPGCLPARRQENIPGGQCNHGHGFDTLRLNTGGGRNGESCPREWDYRRDGPDFRWGYPRIWESLRQLQLAEDALNESLRFDLQFAWLMIQMEMDDDIGPETAYVVKMSS
jgi:hypothetical protein